MDVDTLKRLAATRLGLIAPTRWGTEPDIDEPAHETPAESGTLVRRWEVGFIVGPCHQDEAVALLEELSPVANGRLGAVGAVTAWDDMPELTADRWDEIDVRGDDAFGL